MFGNGCSTANEIYSQIINSGYINDVVAQTSTSTLYLSSIGLLGFIYTYIPMRGVFNINNISLLSKILLIITILIILNKEPHSMMLLTYCIMFYMCDQKGEKIVDEENEH